MTRGFDHIKKHFCSRIVSHPRLLGWQCVLQLARCCEVSGCHCKMEWKSCCCSAIAGFPTIQRRSTVKHIERESKSFNPTCRRGKSLGKKKTKIITFITIHAKYDYYLMITKLSGRLSRINWTNLSGVFLSLVDLLLLLPAVFVFVFIGVFIIVSESVFWFVELLVLLPEFEMVGLVVVRMMVVSLILTTQTCCCWWWWRRWWCWGPHKFRSGQTWARGSRARPSRILNMKGFAGIKQLSIKKKYGKRNGSTKYGRQKREDGKGRTSGRQ